MRSAEQTEAARFHTMPPPLFWTRNWQQFATSQPTLAGNARAMAMLYVVHAGVINTCFETKYHYNRWRPTSAITLADTDGNPATAPDVSWAPVVPTPNHPEYPAAHGCTTGAMAENLAGFFGTRKVAFAFDSTITNTTHEWATVDAAVEEVREARIVSGMHFRFATLAGEKLGVEVARLVARRLDGGR